ncbi:MAG: NAD(P)/FAD-dependent oxidoreductase [Myxococcota bacterium]
MSAARQQTDVAVIGGGPAGTTFAHRLARAGHSVVVVEQSQHPRFCVGESLLPATMPLCAELGLLERFEKQRFARKYGAYFCFEDGAAPEYFHFPDASRCPAEHAYEVRRADFDRVLWEAALEAGAEGRDRTTVERVRFEGERATGLDLVDPDGRRERLDARLVADCSGRTTLLGHQLGLRTRDTKLHKIALYTHYADILRSTGDDAGTIAIVATPFGWMWLIPFSDGGASVGAVIDRSWYGERRRAGVDHDALWAEVLEIVPAVGQRLRGARQSRPLEATADFQYRLDRWAGDGWLVAGDAGAFLDPVFSSGVHLAMTGADRASRAALRTLAKARLPVAADFAAYERESRAALGIYAKFIYAWYDPAFRQVFMRPPHDRPGVGWLKREIISVLAGAVLPTWRVRPPIELLLFFARLRARELQREAAA